VGCRNKKSEVRTSLFYASGKGEIIKAKLENPYFQIFYTLGTSNSHTAISIASANC
jgi:hypothetical protein